MLVFKPGFIAHLEMPAWLRNSSLEGPARQVARVIKGASLSIERRIRLGRVKCQLSATDEWFWLDFYFAAGQQPPAEDPLLTAFLAHLCAGQVVYDVGAFVGWYTLVASRRVSQAGKVIAFEPAPETAKLLRRHCALNEVADYVRVVEAACSNVTSMTKMAVWPTLTTSWASGNALQNVYPKEEVQPTWRPVCTVRLDDFVQSGGTPPDLIKIDVEGAELWVLQGAKAIMETTRPLIFLEIHAFTWHLFDTTEALFRDFIGRVGYELFKVTPPYERLLAIPDYGHAILRPVK